MEKKEEKKTPLQMTIDERMKAGINHHGDPRTPRRRTSKRQLRINRADARARAEGRQDRKETMKKKVEREVREKRQKMGYPPGY